jgi:hypothetical protein
MRKIFAILAISAPFVFASCSTQKYTYTTDDVYANAQDDSIRQAQAAEQEAEQQAQQQTADQNQQYQDQQNQGGTPTNTTGTPISSWPTLNRNYGGYQQGQSGSWPNTQGSSQRPSVVIVVGVQANTHNQQHSASPAGNQQGDKYYGKRNGKSDNAKPAKRKK